MGGWRETIQFDIYTSDGGIDPGIAERVVMVLYSTTVTASERKDTIIFMWFNQLPPNAF